MTSTTSWGDPEDASRRLAADLGVRDFVYRPVLERKGGGTREISDGLLIVGDQGVILQVKGRDPAAAAVDSPERAEEWARKHATAAVRQVRGTRRRLREGREVEVMSLRGFPRTIATEGEWPGVVILHHDHLPDGIMLEAEPSELFLTIDDWYGLNDWLRSTAAVVGYIHRALDSQLHPPLGAEQLRYFRLAHADHIASGGPHSRPLLPFEPIEGRDRVYASFVEALTDRVWPQDGPYRWKHPDDYRRIVELLDRIPPAHRIVLGKKWFDTVRSSSTGGSRRSFFSRIDGIAAQYLFVCDAATRYEDPELDFTPLLAAFATVRHRQAASLGRAVGPTVAVGMLGTLPTGSFLSFVVVEGAADDLDPDLTWEIVKEFGVLDGDSVRDVHSFARNEVCPCMSGRRFKVCHKPTL